MDARTVVEKGGTGGGADEEAQAADGRSPRRRKEEAREGEGTEPWEAVSRGGDLEGRELRGLDAEERRGGQCTRPSGWPAGETTRRRRTSAGLPPAARKGGKVGGSEGGVRRREARSLGVGGRRAADGIFNFGRESILSPQLSNESKINLKSQILKPSN